ncbi:MAG: hypothetical protein HRT52_12675 [Colwellia sp.]|nr:hypothetical protein [Colwellia sp.]
MNKIILLITLLLFSTVGLAKEEVKELPPLDPKYMGHHNLVLFNKGSAIYASHLVSYAEPNNVQILYKLNVQDIALIQLVRDADLVTIKPEVFNLQRMMRGEKFEIKADIYLGHFKRGGMLTYKDMTITFHKKLYHRVMENLEQSNTRQKYDVVQLPRKERILVHKIQFPPSYAQIIYLADDVSCITNFTSSKAVPTPQEVYYKLTYCGAMKPMYYETEDFK